MALFVSLYVSLPTGHTTTKAIVKIMYLKLRREGKDVLPCVCHKFGRMGVYQSHCRHPRRTEMWLAMVAVYRCFFSDTLCRNWGAAFRAVGESKVLVFWRV